MPDIGQNIIITGMATAAAEVAILPQIVTIGTSIGTFFAPNTALAAGGAVKVIAASFAGSLITVIPAGFGLLIAGSMLLTGLNMKNHSLITAGIVVGLIDIVGTYMLAAKIGAAITGATAGAVLTCNLIGAAAMILALAVVVATVAAGAIALFSTFAEGVAPGSSRR